MHAAYQGQLQHRERIQFAARTGRISRTLMKVPRLKCLCGWNPVLAFVCIFYMSWRVCVVFPVRLSVTLRNTLKQLCVVFPCVCLWLYTCKRLCQCECSFDMIIRFTSSGLCQPKLFHLNFQKHWGHWGFPLCLYVTLHYTLKRLCLCSFDVI